MSMKGQSELRKEKAEERNWFNLSSIKGLDIKNVISLVLD